MPRKIQETFFNAGEMPEKNWAYVVEVWYHRDMLDALGRDPRERPEWETAKRPNHFRTEAGAVARAEVLTREFKRPIQLGLVEFRVVPKYIGYVPPADERWIE
jgi:hypothetical protein